MRIFEYPYIIITILFVGFLVMGAVGLYFFLKSSHAANGTEEVGFSGVGKLEGDFRKAAELYKSRSVVYIDISLDSMSRLYSESKAMRILSQIRPLLLAAFCVDGGSLCPYGASSFVAHCVCESEHMISRIEKCAGNAEKILIESGALNIARVTFGIYSTKSTEVNFNTAVSRAKQACTVAEEKKLSFCEWDLNKANSLEKKIKIENNIHSEIENNNFFLEYQPIIDAGTDKIMGAEVLSRLNSGSDGVLSPGAFLSAVNSVGLNEKFDYYIFEKNCKWISNDINRRGGYVYTINFSRSTLCDPAFAENIISLVEKYGLRYSSIAVEILEDRELSDEKKKTMTESISKLREKGVLVLLDDFGKGYTSFTDLSNFAIDIVKIDKEITQKAVSETGFVILKNIIRTAKDLGFRTLCEGIETEEQKRIVCEAGCDFMQGYYFYRPMQVAELQKLLD